MAQQARAIALCRVSSTEQLENNSLNRQRDAVLRAAQELDVHIPEEYWWSGSVSSKRGTNTKRKDLQEVIEQCKKDRRIKYLIVDEPDRFMRSMLEIGYFFVQFKQLGVQVKFASQPDLNADTATNTLLLMLEAYKAEGSNEERQRKSINGQTNALKEGRYTFAPKPGYMKGRLVGVPEVHPIRGRALQKVLLDITYKRVTPTEGLIALNKSEFMSDGHSLYKMDKFRKIVIDPFYAGIVEINKQVQVRNLNGLHEALISLEEHEELVRTMDLRKKTQKGPNKNGNPKYPLNNIVSCDLCSEKSNGRYVGYDHGNGQNPDLVYEKYRCRGCNRYTHKENLHSEIEKQFKSRPISKEGSDDVIEALETVWKREEGQSEQEAIRVKSKIAILERSISSKVDALTDPKNVDLQDEIRNAITKVKEEVSELEGQLINLKADVETDRAEFLAFAYDFIVNMGDNFLDTELVSKENRLRCKLVAFPAGFYVDQDNKVYTPQISELYRLATMKKDTEVSNKVHMVDFYNQARTHFERNC